MCKTNFIRSDWRRLLRYVCFTMLQLSVSVGAVYISPAVHAQTATNITGTVIDTTGEPIIGASVVPEGQSQGVLTDFDGNFKLPLSVPTKLTVNYVGYEPQTVSATPGKPVEIVLHESSALLEEVVVVGFGVQKKVNLTGSVGMATSKDIAGRPVQSTAAALQGVIPGLNISNSSNGGELNAQKQINVRGMSTIGEGSSGAPLVLIDGMEGDINTINPADIESISVLKDAAASSIYLWLTCAFRCHFDHHQIWHTRPLTDTLRQLFPLQ